MLVIKYFVNLEMLTHINSSRRAWLLETLTSYGLEPAITVTCTSNIFWI